MMHKALHARVQTGLKTTFQKSLQTPNALIKRFTNTRPLNGTATQPGKIRLTAQFSDEARLLKKVYRLRYDIFTKEYGARIRSLQRHDKDRYDPFCEHLMVRTEPAGQLVGYTRILPYRASRQLGAFYTEDEFDINSLRAYHPHSAEIGRTCIHPAFRNGATIATLWSRLANYLQHNGIRYLFGCASIGLQDGGHQAQNILNALTTRAAFDESLDVQPRLPLTEFKTRANAQARPEKTTLPPLLKAYINMGARVAPVPHWDTDFNVADLFILLDLEKLNPRYLKRFMSVAAAA